jgi:hypothetical protein
MILFFLLMTVISINTSLYAQQEPSQEQTNVENLEEELGVELEDISIDDINMLEKQITLSQKARIFLSILKVELNRAREIADQKISEHKLAYSLALISTTAILTTLLIWYIKPSFMYDKKQQV